MACILSDFSISIPSRNYNLEKQRKEGRPGISTRTGRHPRGGGGRQQTIRQNFRKTA